MKKENILRSFIANAMALVAVFVLSLSFTACGDEDDFLTTTGTEVPGGNDKPSDPSWKVVAVDGTDCTVTGIEWKASENVSLSSRAYADADMEGFANAVVSHKYTAEIEYADANKTQGNMFKSESKSYTSSLMARLYGLKSAMVFDSVEALENANGKVEKASDEQGYELYTINFGGSRQIVVKSSTTLSTSSLAFEGVSKTDLCFASFAAPEFDSKTYSKVTSDQEGYDKYEMAVKVKLTAEEAGSDNVRYITFKVENVYVKASDNGSDDPVDPTEKELVGYAIRDNQFDGDNTKGNIVKIYDDLSEEKVGSFNVALNHSTVTPEDVTQNGLSSLAWEQGETTSVDLAATGNTRSVEVDANCTVAITEVFSSVTNRSKIPMTFKGLWETARIMFPDGTSADLLVGKYEMEDGTVEATASSETSVTIQHSAYAKFNGETPVELKANVILNKSSEPDVKEAEVAITIENFEVRDENYVFDVVQYWTIAEPTRTAVSIPNYAEISAEDEKATSSRNYNTTAPTMEAGSSTNYSTTVEGTKGNLKISGKITNYTSTFVFEGANVTVSSKYLNYFEVVSAEGHKAVWDIKTSAIKTGVTMGTTDNGDETKHIYGDKVHFALPINSVNVATCEQVLVYTEEITPSEPETPTTDVDATIVENTIDFVNGSWTATMKVTITDSKGGTRDTTITRIYTNAGVSYGSIADFESEDNTFTLPTISKYGTETSEISGNITYTTQAYKSVADKFNQNITVVNGASYVKLAGKTLNFKSTEIAVETTGKAQAEESTFNEGYDVWASSVSYKHGFSNHFDNETTNFNILVERAPIYEEVETDKILAGAITVTVDKNTTPMLSLVISCKNKTIIYSSAYDFKNPTNWVNLKTTPSVHEAFEFKNIPSATLNGEGSDRVPANLIVGNNEWAYYAKGYTRGFSDKDIVTTGCKTPVIAIGELQSDGSLRIKNGKDVVYFKVK